MSNANKNKGKTFERDIAHHLSDVFGLNFNRVPNSGAFVGGKNFFRKDKLSESQQTIFTGDIIMPDELNKFAIECKFYKDFPFHHLYSDCKVLNKWIEQAKSTDRIWFLMFRINNCGTFLCFDRKYEQNYIIETNKTYYSSYVVLDFTGFFEKNKESILKMNQAVIC